MSKLIKPDTNSCSDKVWTKWWWNEFNDLCLKCKRSCKQSWRVKVSCKQFERIEKEIDTKEIDS
jgi:hypothetical protein